MAELTASCCGTATQASCCEPGAKSGCCDPAAHAAVVISNCVINLSGDKPRVLREVARVLKPGGRPRAVWPVVVRAMEEVEVCHALTAVG